MSVRQILDMDADMARKIRLIHGDEFFQTDETETLLFNQDQRANPLGMDIVLD